MTLNLQCACGAEFEKENTKLDTAVCPQCGTRNLTIKMFFEDRFGLAIHDEVRFKLKEPGAKNPKIEVKAGEKLSHFPSEWVDFEQEIDRTVTPPWYDKVVKRKNGEIIHECHESLLDHFGHGSAKKKKSD